MNIYEKKKNFSLLGLQLSKISNKSAGKASFPSAHPIKPPIMQEFVSVSPPFASISSILNNS